MCYSGIGKNFGYSISAFTGNRLYFYVERDNMSHLGKGYHFVIRIASGLIAGSDYKSSTLTIRVQSSTAAQCVPSERSC